MPCAISSLFVDPNSKDHALIEARNQLQLASPPLIARLSISVHGIPTSSAYLNPTFGLFL